MPKRISQLPEASSVSQGDYVPVVVQGVTKKVTVANLGVGSPGGGNVSTANGDAPQAGAQVDTTDATATNIGSAIALATDSITMIDVAVQCIQAGATKAKIFSVRRSFLNDGGTVTDGTQTNLTTPEELGGALAASVAITRTGATAQPMVTGVAATALRWYLISQAMKVTAATGAVPAAPTAIAPTSGTESGGTVVQITVPSSTGITGAKVGGVALTSFSIVNATTVQGTTGVHATGAVDVVVSNIYGDSPPLAGGYTYTAAWTPASLNLAAWWKPSFTGTFPHAGTASAGASGAGSRDLLALGGAGTEPIAGTAVDGKTPAVYDGTNDYTEGETFADNYLAAGGYGGCALVWIDAITTDNDTDNQQNLNNQILTHSDGVSSIYLRSNAGAPLVGITHYDGTLPYKKAAISIATGAWRFVKWRYVNGTGIQIGVGATWSAAIPAADLSGLGTTFLFMLGRNYNGTVFTQFRHLDVFAMQYGPSDADFDNIRTYLQAQYPSLSI